MVSDFEGITKIISVIIERNVLKIVLARTRDELTGGESITYLGGYCNETSEVAMDRGKKHR